MTRTSYSARELSANELVDGRFHVEAKLGEGAQGAVFRAFDRKLRRLCALKFLGGDPDDAESTARFRREGRLGMNLRHANLVEVFETDKRWRDTPYMVMELLEDFVPLAERWSDLRWPGFLVIAKQVAAVLDYLAEYDLVHRDLSPANVLIDGANKVKVIDLGLAHESDSTLTKSSMIDLMGSPGFLPPEQLERANAAEPASDQWALAAIVYQVLTGIPPHFDDLNHEDGPEMAALQRVADGTPVRHPSELNPSVSAELAAAVMRALSMAPGARFRSSTAFVVALCEAPTRQLELPFE